MKSNPKTNARDGFIEHLIYLGPTKFRGIDGIKNNVGLEIKFGRYDLISYDIFSRMPLFKVRGLIECGIEVVASQQLSPLMPTSVSSYDQIVRDKKTRGEADVDIPTVIIGIGAVAAEIPGSHD